MKQNTCKNSCYYEKQVAQQCVVHALNAYLGAHTLTCKMLVDYGKAQQKWSKIQQMLWNEHVGFFSPSVAFAWMATERDLHQRTLGQFTAKMSANEKRKMMQDSGHSRFFINKFEIRHAVTVIRLDEKRYCLVDSLQEEPLELGKSPRARWKDLVGQVSVFDSRPPDPDSTVIDLT